MALERRNHELIIRQLMMIAIDGGVNVLLEDFGFLGREPIDGYVILNSINNSSYPFIVYDHKDYAVDYRKPLVMKFRTSRKRFAFLLGNVSYNHRYLVSFHNSTDINRWQPSPTDDELSVGIFGESRLMHLPPELISNILSLLPGDDLARLACVCSGLKSLCDSEDLWRQKFQETFRRGPRFKSLPLWKQRFALASKVSRHDRKMGGKTKGGTYTAPANIYFKDVIELLYEAL